MSYISLRFRDVADLSHRNTFFADRLLTVALCYSIAFVRLSVCL